jgi:hypothetical protein
VVIGIPAPIGFSISLPHLFSSMPSTLVNKVPEGRRLDKIQAEIRLRSQQ